MPYFNNPYQGMDPYSGYNMPNYQQQMQQPQQLQRQEIIHVNGQQGANASILAAAITTLNVQGEDKVRCCDGGSNITFEITAGTTSHTVVLSNANVIVEKS